jgi:hypothetical protein
VALTIEEIDVVKWQDASIPRAGVLKPVRSVTGTRASCTKVINEVRHVPECFWRTAGGKAWSPDCLADLVEGQAP